MINIGVLGAGHIAKKLSSTMAFLRNECVTPYAISSRDKSRADEIKEAFDYHVAYGSYEEMLADKNIDLVYIATPHSHHYEHMKLCLEHGKNILCEKAFTVNAKQAEEIFNIAKSKNLFVCEAFWTRFMPCVKAIKDVIGNGEIGEAKFIEATFGICNHTKERMCKPELAGGALLDLGIYPLNFALMHFGDDYENIGGVAKLTDAGVDAQSSFHLSYSDGRIASLSTSMMAFHGAPARISGTEGYINLDKMLTCQEFTIHKPDGTLIRKVDTPFDCNGYEYEFRAVAKAIENGKLECEEMTWSNTLASMRAMDKLREIWGVKYPCE